MTTNDLTQPTDGKISRLLQFCRRPFAGACVRLICSLLLFAPLAESKAATKYVATWGSDTSGNGEPGTPWQKIQTAVYRTVPGDTIIVRPGVYAEVVQFFNRHGSPSAWTTLRGDPGALINGWVQVHQSSYIQVSHFEITNNLEGAPGMGAHECHHIAFRFNTIHDVAFSGASCSSSDWIWIEGNTIWGCAGRYTYQGSGISVYQARDMGTGDASSLYHYYIRNNVIGWNRTYVPNPVGQVTDGNGIIIDDFRNTQNGSPYGSYPHWTLVEGNLCFHNGGAGINIFYSHNVLARNNTCYMNGRSAENGTANSLPPWVWPVGEFTVFESAQVNLANNIAFGRDPLIDGDLYAYYSDGYSWGTLKARNNTKWNGRHQFPTGANFVVRDPKLVNPDGGDYRLQSVSPEINTGSTSYSGLTAPRIPWYPYDLSWRSRTNGAAIDRGAYEF